MNFARRALHLYPDDYPSLTLLEELLIQESHLEEALQFRERIQALEHSSDNEMEERHQDRISFEKFQSSATTPSAPEELHAYALKSSKQTGSTAVIEEKKISAKSFEQNLNTSPPFIGVSQYNPPISSQSICFTSLHSQDTDTTPRLTHRLYASFSENKSPFGYLTSPPKVASMMTPVEELKKLANTFVDRAPIPSHPIPSLNQEAIGEEILEHRIKTFHQQQRELISNYLDRFKTRPALKDQCLYLLHGWHDSHQRTRFLTGQSRKTTGGYYLRWNGKGIVINPGLHFLENFHQQGLHIKDIDYVIVTGESASSYADIQEIYELNYQLNKISSELQIIHYYLSPKAYQALSPALKPNFKQERHTVHCLELFLDSPDVEKIELNDGINFSYFPLKSQRNAQEGLSKEERNTKSVSSLGLHFDLSTHHLVEKQSIRLGYASGAPWSPLLGHHLGHCDLLIAGFGNTNPGDYSKLKYNEESLGYHGTFSLLEETTPKLLLCSEFDCEEGDVRLEAVKMMREQYAAMYPNARHMPTILPVDNQLLLDLATLQVQCSATKTSVDPSRIRVVKLADSFGNLQYLSPSCTM